jgi:DNA-binding MarR family transcriptional regulator
MFKSRFPEADYYMMELFNRSLELSKKSYEYCPGVSLYPNEIHTVEYIAESSTTNMTDIANRMGITKGAVTKMVAKLEEQGLLVRYKYRPSQKEIYVHLTELGVSAYEGHKAYHAVMRQQLSSSFDGLDRDHQQTILDFLELYLAEMNNLEN